MTSAMEATESMLVTDGAAAAAAHMTHEDEEKVLSLVREMCGTKLVPTAQLDRDDFGHTRLVALLDAQRYGTDEHNKPMDPELLLARNGSALHKREKAAPVAMDHWSDTAAECSKSYAERYPFRVKVNADAGNYISLETRWQAKQAWIRSEELMKDDFLRERRAERRKLLQEQEQNPSYDYDDDESPTQRIPQHEDEAQEDEAWRLHRNETLGQGRPHHPNDALRYNTLGSVLPALLAACWQLIGQVHRRTHLLELS